MFKEVDIQVSYENVVNFAEGLGVEKLLISTTNDASGNRKLFFFDTKLKKMAYEYTYYTKGLERDFTQIGFFKNSNGDLKAMIKGMEKWYGYDLMDWSDFYELEASSENKVA